VLDWERDGRGLYLYVADLAVEMILAKWERHPTQIPPARPLQNHSFIINASEDERES
jgi:hypothetical protein